MVLLKNQSAINAFYKPSEDKKKMLDTINVRVEQVSRSILDRNDKEVKEKLGSFFAGILIEDIQYFEENFGPLRTIDMIGTQPLPWDNPKYHSLIVLRFQKKEVDFRIVWGKESIYETWTDSGFPEGFPVFTSQINQDIWLIHDFIFHKSLKTYRPESISKDEIQVK